MNYIIKSSVRQEYWYNTNSKGEWIALPYLVILKIRLN